MGAAGRLGVLAVIPARFGSTRFPGRVIASLALTPFAANTYVRTCQAGLVSEAIVATDDQRVLDALAPLGIPAVMTRPGHPSGTDRAAEAAADSDAPITVNVQGGVPLIGPDTIDAVVETKSIGVDTPEDLERARALIESALKGGN